jgi:hypothetical protein
MEPKPFPFKEKADTACFSCKHVVHEHKPILLVSHEVEDEAWQFMCGNEGHEEKDAVIVKLDLIYNYDTSIGRIADMPLGLFGVRANLKSEWKFYKTKEN